MAHKSEYSTVTRWPTPSCNHGLPHYLREINRTPLLTRSEERELGQRIRNGDNGARDWLVGANLRFVVSIAMRYVNLGLSLEDLIGEGNQGLVSAARRFDAERGCKFISHAEWWIRQAIQKALLEHTKIGGLPLSHLRVSPDDIARRSGEFDQEPGRASSPAEVARRIRLPEKKFRGAMNTAPTSRSQDDPPSYDMDASLLDYLVEARRPKTDDETMAHLLRDDVARVITRMSEREKLVLKLYFGLSGEEPMTLAEIAKHFDLTAERVSRIKDKAIRRLRRI